MGLSEEKYKYIINTSSDMITLINRDYSYEVVNDSYCNVIGRLKKEILGSQVSQVWGEAKFNNTIKQYLDRCFDGEEIHYVDQFEFGNSYRYMHVSYYPYTEETGAVSHALVFSHDITKLGEIETKLFNYEFRDSVTGLFNERSLEIILDMELEKAKRARGDKKRSLIILSVNNYQSVCLSHGRMTGNMLLENTGIRIKDCLRSTDYVFRYTGNELAIILTTMASDTEPVIVAQKLLNMVTIPYRKDENKISLNCTLGIAIAPEDGQDCESLITSASKALARALHEGEEFRLFDSTTHRTTLSRLQIENDLNRAFDLKQFELHYQPIVDAHEKVVGCESLIRWNHPDRGMVSPSLFIPISEHIGLISALSKWVLFKASRQISKWSRDYDIYTSVNLTVKEYADENLPSILQAALKQAGNLPSRFLRLEITESETMIRPEDTIQKMQRLRDLGFEIMVDDFGTGHSSLSYLKDIPADTLKLDKSFIDMIASDKDSRDFLELIAHLAKNRRKSLIIEGVETRNQFEILLNAGCKLFQGYLFSPPLPPDQFEEYLQKNLKKRH